MMTADDLPVGAAPAALPTPHFPTRFQAVIWRNWELVPPKRLAAVLHATAQEILGAASALGLETPRKVGYADWSERGFLTIIRRNWHLLNYPQLLELLDWTPERLAFVLKEDDFFWIKLGELKPTCEAVYFRALTPEEEQLTRCIHDTVRQELAALPPLPVRRNPFDFYPPTSAPKEITESDGLRLIYSYTALYGDPLLDDPAHFYPECELQRYREFGINGIWFQTPLYSLVPWAGATPWSARWQKRLQSLRDLTERAARYGIKVFLYVNEPRAMPEAFFVHHPEWRGAIGKVEGCIAMCPSAPGMPEALAAGVARLSREVPLLGGLIAITMSENLTHCQSHAPEGIVHSCPRCVNATPDQLVHRVLSAMQHGLHVAGHGARLIAWNWGWQSPWDEKLVRTLPPEIGLMLVSETGLQTMAGGIAGSVLDYSISQVGPAPGAQRLLEVARDANREVMVKIQANNSWELAAVPYLPVPGLVAQHLARLRAFGVNDFMLSWTHGGYPGGNLELLRLTPEELAVRDYGQEAAPEILAAWHDFEEAFRNFPFHSVDAIYFAPQHYGPANLLYREATGYRATMIGFPYDDLSTWHGGHYPDAVFHDQFRRLSDQWQQGLAHWRLAEAAIAPVNHARWLENYRLAEAAGIHWFSCCRQIHAVILRRTGHTIPAALYVEEAESARKLFRLQQEDARIGFEASNHYFYTGNDLLEKILNCNLLAQ